MSRNAGSHWQIWFQLVPFTSCNKLCHVPLIPCEVLCSQSPFWLPPAHPCAFPGSEQPLPLWHPCWASPVSTAGDSQRKEHSSSPLHPRALFKITLTAACSLSQQVYFCALKIKSSPEIIIFSILKWPPFQGSLAWVFMSHSDILRRPGFPKLSSF